MSEIEVNRRRLVSKLAPTRIQAASRITIMGGVSFAGIAFAIVAWVLAPSTTSVLLASIGATMLCTGLLGMYVYSKVLNSVLAAEDIIEVSKRPDPSEAGPPRAVIGKKKSVRGNSLVVGPVRLTVEQWRLITQKSKSLGWRWARKSVWEDSGANVSNLNKRYGTMIEWMNKHEFIEDLANNSSRPEYVVTPPGQAMLADVCAGQAPVLGESGVR